MWNKGWIFSLQLAPSFCNLVNGLKNNKTTLRFVILEMVTFFRLVEILPKKSLCLITVPLITIFPLILQSIKDLRVGELLTIATTKPLPECYVRTQVFTFFSNKLTTFSEYHFNYLNVYSCTYRQLPHSFCIMFHIPLLLYRSDPSI